MKFFISLMLFFMSFLCKAEYMIIDYENYNDWQKYGTEDYGQVSFYAAVTTTEEVHTDGYFYYDIYFFNNSFYKSGKESSTYLSDVSFHVWIDGIWTKVFYQPYILIGPSYGENEGILHAIYI